VVPELCPRVPWRAGRSAFFVAALLLRLLCRTVSADEPIEQRLDALFGEHERYLAFFPELKDAVIRDDRKKVAGLVNYPLNVFTGRRRMVVRSPAELLRRYREVFNDNVIEAVKAQEPDTLFANWQGVMVGDGQIWFAGVCAGKDRDTPCADKVIKVITVNTKASGS
jgi:hypothetical protein